MYIVARITIILVSHCVLQVKASKSVTKALTVSANFPSRLYLPTSPNLEPKNRARTSDIEAVLENDLQVIPLAADHDQRNGFQYQPIISRQYSRGSTESPRYLQSAVPNLPQTVNTGQLGSPISDANEVKPITKSHLSRETVAYSSTPKGNNPSQEIRRGSFWCLRRFQSQEKEEAPFELVQAENLLRRKILTVNDQESNDDTHPERIRLQLTHPRIGISSRTSVGHKIDKVSQLQASFSTKSSATSVPLSKDTILIGEPSAYSGQDIKPVFEGNEHGTVGHDNYNNPYYYNERDYQLGNHNIPDDSSTSGYFKAPFKRPVTSSNIAAGITCSDILGRFLLQTYARGYNYGYNNNQHPPTNPILALLLTHYGIYLPRLQGTRVYSYMAVNNIHNNKPFGSYKLNGDEDSSFVP